MSCLVGSSIDYRNFSYQEQIERVDRLKEETIRMIREFEPYNARYWQLDVSTLISVGLETRTAVGWRHY